MAQMRMEILIAAPVDKVYDFVANVENHPRYADFVERLDITSPYRLGLGVTFNQYLHLGGETVAVPSPGYRAGAIAEGSVDFSPSGICHARDLSIRVHRARHSSNTHGRSPLV